MGEICSTHGGSEMHTFCSEIFNRRDCVGNLHHTRRIMQVTLIKCGDCFPVNHHIYRKCIKRETYNMPVDFLIYYERP
jgi:hypothetical protein